MLSKGRVRDVANQDAGNRCQRRLKIDPFTTGGFTGSVFRRRRQQVPSVMPHHQVTTKLPLREPKQMAAVMLRTRLLLWTAASV